MLTRGIRRGAVSPVGSVGASKRLHCVEPRTPWLWVSNRGEQHPCWHTTFLGKYSVLYLCFRLTLERGWLRHLLCGQIAVDGHFSAAVGQMDFVRMRTK